MAKGPRWTYRREATERYQYFTDPLIREWKAIVPDMRGVDITKEIEHIMAEQERSTFIELTGLWMGKDRKGQPMLTGAQGGAVYMVLKNNYKTQENHPDFRLVITKAQKREEKKTAADNFFGGGETAPAGGGHEDDIPF